MKKHIVNLVKTRSRIVWDNRQQYLTDISEISLVGLALAIPLSTAAMHFFVWLAVISGWGAGKLREKCEQILSEPVILLSGLIFILWLLGMAHGHVPWSDRFAMLGKYIKYLLLLLLFPLFNRAAVRQASLATFIISLAVLMLLCYYKLFGIFYDGPRYGETAMFHSYIETNFLMSLFAYVLLQMAVIWKPLRFWFLLLLVPVLIYILLINPSRTGYIVFLSLLALFYWQHKRWRGLIYAFVIGAMLIAIGTVCSHEFRDRWHQANHELHEFKSGDADTSVGLRLYFAKAALSMVRHHPFFGVGTGAFKHEFGLRSEVIQSDNAHNEYLMVASQLGLVGLLVFLGFLYAQWRQSYYLPSAMQYLAQGILLAIMVGSLANSWILDTVEGYSYIYLVALSLAARKDAVSCQNPMPQLL